MSFLSDLANQAKKKAAQVYQTAQNDIAHIGAAPHPVQINSPQVIQKLQTGRYGVLAEGNNRNAYINQLNNAQAQARPTFSNGLANLGAAQNQAVMQTLVHPITRAIPEVINTGRDLRNRGTYGATYTPGSEFEKGIFGETPVQSIQQKTIDQYRRDMSGRKTPGAKIDTSGVRRALAVPLAGAEVAGSLLNDLPVVGALANVGYKAGRVALPGVQQAAGTIAPKLAPIAQKGATVAAQGLKTAATAPAKIPDALAHQQLIKTDPYYATAHGNLVTAQQAFERNAANGMSARNATQVQLSKIIKDETRRTNEIRGAIKENFTKKVLPNQKGFVKLPGGGDNVEKRVQDLWKKYDQTGDDRIISEIDRLQTEGAITKAKAEGYNSVTGKFETPKNRTDLPMSKRYVSEGAKQGETVYHGTSKENAASIKTNGFNPTMGRGKGFSGQTDDNFTFVTPHKASAKYFADNNLRTGDKGEVVPAQFNGKVLEIKGTMADYEAMGKAHEILGVPMKNGHMLNPTALKKALADKGYAGISFKDKNSNGRLSYAISDNKALANSAPSDTKSLKREIAELDRKINAFEGDSPARQNLIDRQIQLVEELEGGKQADSPLHAEARKYKNADEFIKAQGDRLYHTTGNKFDKFDNKYVGDTTNGISPNLNGGFFFTDNLKDIEAFKNTLKNGVESFNGDKLDPRDVSNFRTIEKVADKSKFLPLNPYRLFNNKYSEKDAKAISELFGEDIEGLSSKEIRENLQDMFDEFMPGDLELALSNASSEMPKILDKYGYHGYTGDMGSGSTEYVIIDPNKLHSPSELTDIYNQAHANNSAPRSTSNIVDKIKKNLPNLKDQNGYVKIPSRAKDPAPDLKPVQKEFVNQYAEMIEDMEKSGGAAKVVTKNDGSRFVDSAHSPFYKKIYEQTGRPPTKYDWFIEARRQIESGKAAYGASEEFAALTTGPKQLPKSSLQAPGPGVSRKTVDSSKASLAQPKQTRPQASLQAAIEQAHNSGNSKLEAKLVKQADPGMNPSGSISPERRAELMAKMHATGTGSSTSPKRPLSGVEQSPPGTQSSKSIQSNRTASLPDNTKKQLPTVPNSLTKGAKDGRQNLSPKVQKGVQGSHVVRSTGKLQENAIATSDKTGIDATIKQAHAALDVELGKIDDKVVASAQQAIERADAAGRIDDAIAIHDKLSEHLTKNGQTIQAASLLYRLSPSGMVSKATRELKKGGATITPELEARLKEQAKAIGQAQGDAAKTRARAEFSKTVVDNIPKGKVNDILSVWKAGLLSGVKTQQGNALSNFTFGVLKKVSDVPASMIDASLAVFTGKRTKVATGRGIVDGSLEGLKKGINTMKTGIDERNITGMKYEQHGELNFKNPVIQNVFGKPANLVFRGMSAADQPFYYAAAKNNLYDQALAVAKNQKVPLSQRSQFVRNLVDNPTPEMAQTAEKAANKAVLSYDTVASKMISGAHQQIDRMDIAPAFKSTAHGVVTVLAPFVRVPSAFLSRTVDFTPAGPLREAIGQISTKKFDQRALAEALGQGMTGTGVIALGIALAQQKLVSGDYPKNDVKEAQRWKAEGVTPNSVKLGDKWINLNYLGPVGLLFNAGKQFHDAKSEAALGKVAAAVGGLGQGLMGQSFLQGFSGFSDAISDPERNAKSFVNSQASSVVPAIVNDVANATDKMQRQADTVSESVKNRIPGLRQTNKPKQDVYGNPLSQAAGQLNTLNGLKPSNSLTNRNPVIAEVSRLHYVDTTNKDLSITPTPVDKTVTVNKKQIPLTNDQRYQLQKKVGNATQDAWNKLIQTPEYRQLDDIEKAKALSNLRTDIAILSTRDYVVSNDLGIYDKQPTKRQLALAAGDVKQYVTGSTTIKSTTPKKSLPTPSKTATKRTTSSKNASTGTKSTKTTTSRATGAGSRSPGGLTAEQKRQLARGTNNLSARIAFSKKIRGTGSKSGKIGVTRMKQIALKKQASPKLYRKVA